MDSSKFKSEAPVPGKVVERPPMEFHIEKIVYINPQKKDNGILYNNSKATTCSNTAKVAMTQVVQQEQIICNRNDPNKQKKIIRLVQTSKAGMGNNMKTLTLTSVPQKQKSEVILIPASTLGMTNMGPPILPMGERFSLPKQFTMPHEKPKTVMRIDTPRPKTTKKTILKSHLSGSRPTDGEDLLNPHSQVPLTCRPITPQMHNSHLARCKRTNGSAQAGVTEIPTPSELQDELVRTLHSIAFRPLQDEIENSEVESSEDDSGSLDNITIKAKAVEGDPNVNFNESNGNIPGFGCGLDINEYDDDLQNRESTISTMNANEGNETLTSTRNSEVTAQDRQYVKSISAERELGLQVAGQENSSDSKDTDPEKTPENNISGDVERAGIDEIEDENDKILRDSNRTDDTADAKDEPQEEYIESDEEEMVETECSQGQDKLKVKEDEKVIKVDKVKEKRKYSRKKKMTTQELQTDEEELQERMLAEAWSLLTERLVDYVHLPEGVMDQYQRELCQEFNYNDDAVAMVTDKSLYVWQLLDRLGSPAL